jgi:hypothetical protein
MAQDNNAELRKIIRELKLTRKQVADIALVTTSTVDRWLVPPKRGRKRNPTYRKMPDNTLQLLKMVLSPDNVGMLKLAIPNLNVSKLRQINS